MEYEDYLKHYGIKGMKWGKRKKKERKLSPRKAKKVEKLDQRVSESNSEIERLRNKKQDANIAQKVGINYKIRQTKKQRDLDAYDSNAIKRGKLTSKQRDVAGAAAGTAIGIGILAAPYVLYEGNAALHNIADSKRKRDAGRAAASRLADTRGINNFRTVDLSVGADGEWR